MKTTDSIKKSEDVRLLVKVEDGTPSLATTLNVGDEIPKGRFTIGVYHTADEMGNPINRDGKYSPINMVEFKDGSLLSLTKVKHFIAMCDGKCTVDKTAVPPTVSIPFTVIIKKMPVVPAGTNKYDWDSAEAKKKSE